MSGKDTDEHDASFSASSDGQNNNLPTRDRTFSSSSRDDDKANVSNGQDSPAADSETQDFGLLQDGFNTLILTDNPDSTPAAKASSSSIGGDQQNNHTSRDQDSGDLQGAKSQDSGPPRNELGQRRGADSQDLGDLKGARGKDSRNEIGKRRGSDSQDFEPPLNNKKQPKFQRQGSDLQGSSSSSSGDQQMNLLADKQDFEPPLNNKKQPKFQRQGSDSQGSSSSSSSDQQMNLLADKQDADELPEPLDIGKFQIKVDWTGQFPAKWKIRLEKALQTWLGSLDSTFTAHTVELMDDQCCAVVQITPSSALGVLKNHTKACLKFKDIKDGKDKDKEVTAQICLDYPKSKPVPQKSMAENRASSPKANSSTSVTSANADTTNNVENVAPSAKSPLILPLHLSWYIYNAYKNELEAIGKRHGVNFLAEVSISVKPIQKPGPDSVSKATEEFEKLIWGCVDTFSDVTITHNDMDSDIVKNAIESIKSRKTKLMFTQTDSSGLFLGPKKFIDMIRENTTSEERQSDNRAIPIEEDYNAFSQSRPSLDMNTQDLPTHLEVDKVYWDLMKLSYEDQLSQIEAKYGVSFNADNLQEYVKVQVRSTGVQHVNLEGHAVRALTHLYQKLASAAVSCELKNRADQTDVRSVVEKLHRGYCVVAAESLGPWRLVGLPEHLGPAIAETEEILQRKVFDDKMKRLIGYSEDIPHARGIKLNQDYGAGAAGGPRLDMGVNFREEIKTEAAFSKDSKGNSGHESKDADAEEETCAICIDSFTDKEKLKCGHEFCRQCLKMSVDSLGSICPVCKEVFGKLEGNQPEGIMQVTKSRTSLPGYSRCGTIEIYYNIPSGTQTKKHPNPGNPYLGTVRYAYLPDNDEGGEVLMLLKRAFNQKLIFTVGTSTTTGVQNAVTWNDIHHKTSRSGGPQSYGYPDPDYLNRVKDELKAKGIE